MKFLTIFKLFLLSNTKILPSSEMIHWDFSIDCIRRQVVILLESAMLLSTILYTHKELPVQTVYLWTIALFELCSWTLNTLNYWYYQVCEYWFTCSRNFERHVFILLEHNVYWTYWAYIKVTHVWGARGRLCINYY